MLMERGGENLYSERDCAEVCVAGEEDLAKSTFLPVVLLHLEVSRTSSLVILSCHEIALETVLCVNSTKRRDSDLKPCPSAADHTWSRTVMSLEVMVEIIGPYYFHP